MAAKKTVLSIAIDRELLSKLKELSKEKSYSVSKLISKLLEEVLYLEENVFKDEIYKNIDWLSEEWKDKLQVLFTKVLDTTPDPIWIKDLNLRIIYVNQAFANLFGLKKEDLIGKSDIEVLPADVAKECIFSDMKALESKKSSHSVEKIKAADGREIIFDVIKTPIYDKTGKIIAILGISRDITEFVRVQEELEKKNKELEEAYKKLQEIYEYDIVTGLVKKRRFLQIVREALNQMEKGQEYTLINIEVANLMYANEMYGYEFGSKVLREFSKKLKDKLEEMGFDFVLSKIGGNKFGLFVKDDIVNRHILRKFLNFVKSIRIPTPDEESFFVPKIIFAVRKISKEDTKDLEKILLQMEDLLMHLKEGGKRNFVILRNQPVMYTKYIELEKKIKKSLEEGKLNLQLKPIKDLQELSVHGHQVVCSFDEIDEKDICYLMENASIDNVLRKIDQKLFDIIKRKVYPNTDKTIFVRLRQTTLDRVLNLPEDKITKDIMYIKDRTVFMVTENTFNNSYSNILELKNNYNLKFCLDNFGVGNTSIKMLTRMIEHDMFQYIKINSSFIKTSIYSAKRKRILKGVLAISNEFGIKTIASGVDSEEVFDFVKDIGFEFAEGSYIGESLDVENLKQYLLD
ncbi:PAS domain S-box-containing protein/diguanylate cyclase (GGDEF) domain-containing protein [Persephonella hydrogeniphila]|uniref:PAS domain S-box-containing protein/diguanylate cyclase (GGDEF) domain-containing protein n=1 Tax=Persephonella hydrogeniphila TaxID=198703 RepID=A0A285N1S6_9AQUI|nr:EAL domain-containing protein [Persephonella hydrogeniphila]SNZ03402.1 PAS domain S-box-containing protein/diguanylate cyclase (GGDEF) domain-containing protein [Persephonella hydrogeniphila]